MNMFNHHVDLGVTITHGDLQALRDWVWHNCAKLAHFRVTGSEPRMHLSRISFEDDHDATMFVLMFGKA